MAKKGMKKGPLHSTAEKSLVTLTREVLTELSLGIRIVMLMSEWE